MLNFKHKKDLLNLYDSNKEKLFAYVKNLSPIFIKTELTNEDIFNFAFYKTLPLDKEKNKVLLIDYINNKELIEIKSLPVKKTDNLNSYINYISTNRNDKIRIDSLLSLYKARIYQNIFSGDNDVYAINPNIFLLRENLIDDLSKISEKINLQKTKILFPVNNIKKLDEIENNIELKNKFNFLLITRDTVFETKISFDINRLKQIVEDHESKLNSPKLKLNVKIDKNIVPKNYIDFNFDSSQINVLLNIEKIKNNLDDSLFQNINKNIYKDVNYFEKHNTNKDIKIHKPILIFTNPNELSNQAFTSINNINISKIANEAIKKDSIHLKYLNDSLKLKIKESVQKANSELKKLKLD